MTVPVPESDVPKESPKSILFQFVFFPLGGSPEELDRQLTSLRAQIRERRTALDHAKTIAVKVEKGRDQGDVFMDQYFLNSRNAYSTIVSDLVDSAKRAQIKAKDHSYQTEPIEGSEDLTMMSIVGSYEGTYSDLLHFVNEIDRSFFNEICARTQDARLRPLPISSRCSKDSGSSLRRHR